MDIEINIKCKFGLSFLEKVYYNRRVWRFTH